MAELLTDDQIESALRDLPDWERRGDALVRAVTAAGFLAGIRLVDAVAEVAEQRNHHPDIDIRWTTITFSLTTHSASGITDGDVQLAHAIDQTVRAQAEG